MLALFVSCLIVTLPPDCLPPAPARPHQCRKDLEASPYITYDPEEQVGMEIMPRERERSSAMSR